MYGNTTGINRAYWSGQGPIPSIPAQGVRAPEVYEYRLPHQHPMGRVMLGDNGYLVGPIAPYPSVVGSYLPGPIPHHPEYPGGLGIEGMGSFGYNQGDTAGYHRFGRRRVGSYIAPPSVGSAFLGL